MNKAIILLHGALGSSEDLAALATELSARDLSVHRFSFSGHGDTEQTNEFGITAFASQLEKYIARNALTGCTVFGYSMGGYVALSLAAEKQDLIRRIVTLGTKFEWTIDVTQREAAFCNADLLREKAPDFLASLEKKHKNLTPLLEQSRQMILSFDHQLPLDTEKLKSISIPVLLLRGELDRMVTAAETTTVADTIPAGSFLTIPSAKHVLETVDAKKLTEIICQFLSL